MGALAYIFPRHVRMEMKQKRHSASVKWQTADCWWGLTMFNKHHPAADIYTIPENPARPAQRECLKVTATGKNVTILAQRSQFRTIFFVLVDDLASPI